VVGSYEHSNKPAGSIEGGGNFLRVTISFSRRTLLMELVC